ncbi:MAG: universal stress protein [Candidatus Nitrosopolaris sp.]
MDKNVDRGAEVAVKKILTPIDRSGYKEKILAYAVSLGKAWGAELTVIHVIDPGRGVPGGRVKEKEREREEEAKRQAEVLVLNTIDPLIRKEGINIKKEVIEESDTVEKAIIDYAKKNNIDVIVIGTKGMTAVEEYFFGSVANAVIHHAHCSVFAIR